MPGPGKGGGDSSETTRPGPHRAAPHGTGRIVVMPMSKAEAHRNPLVRRVHFQNESAEPWYLEKGREAMRQANAGKAAQESIAQMESEMQNSKRKLTRQLGEWVNCLTERIECADVLDEMLEDASEDLEPTAEGEVIVNHLPQLVGQKILPQLRGEVIQYHLHRDTRQLRGEVSKVTN